MNWGEAKREGTHTTQEINKHDARKGTDWKSLARGHGVFIAVYHGSAETERVCTCFGCPKLSFLINANEKLVGVACL
jgi:hypothetical protein